MMRTNGTPRSTKAHGIRYPWERWFARRSVVLRRGVDFDGAVHGFLGTARHAAKRMGLRLRAVIVEDSVVITVLRGEG